MIKRGTFSITEVGIFYNGKQLYLSMNFDSGGNLRRYVGIYHRYGKGGGCCVALARLLCWIKHGKPPSRKHHADHIDRNSMNDSMDNLCWLPMAKNMGRHRYDDKTPAEIARRQMIKAFHCKLYKNMESAPERGIIGYISGFIPPMPPLSAIPDNA